MFFNDLEEKLTNFECVVSCLFLKLIQIPVEHVAEREYPHWMVQFLLQTKPSVLQSLVKMHISLVTLMPLCNLEVVWHSILAKSELESKHSHGLSNLLHQVKLLLMMLLAMRQVVHVLPDRHFGVLEDQSMPAGMEHFLHKHLPSLLLQLEIVGEGE